MSSLTHTVLIEESIFLERASLCPHNKRLCLHIKATQEPIILALASGAGLHQLLSAITCALFFFLVQTECNESTSSTNFTLDILLYLATIPYGFTDIHFVFNKTCILIDLYCPIFYQRAIVQSTKIGHTFLSSEN